LFLFGEITRIGLEKYQALRLSYSEKNSWHTANSISVQNKLDASFWKTTEFRCTTVSFSSVEILTRRSTVKFAGLLLLRQSGTELRVDHPKTTKIPPNHRDFNGHSVEF
jgi:hypothetical protein